MTGKIIYISEHPTLTARCRTAPSTKEKILASPRIDVTDVNIFNNVPTCPLFKLTDLSLTINRTLKEKK